MRLQKILKYLFTKKPLLYLYFFIVFIVVPGIAIYLAKEGYSSFILQISCLIILYLSVVVYDKFNKNGN